MVRIVVIATTFVVAVGVASCGARSELACNECAVADASVDEIGDDVGYDPGSGFDVRPPPPPPPPSVCGLGSCGVGDNCSTRCLSCRCEGTSWSCRPDPRCDACPREEPTTGTPCSSYGTPCYYGSKTCTWEFDIAWCGFEKWVVGRHTDPRCPDAGPPASTTR